ncbi:hypothetical protein F5H01DRAFT_49918 [Linnemannia elongata]|nr:hypothetical protein F5H01DRAFT_49918 [Linnemannia elongata]
MGRPVARNLEDEMMTKIKALFDRILDTVNKENPQYTFDFEQFVDCFDENDHFTKRVFEFLVKETAQRYRSAHPQPQYSSHPRVTIHHLPGGGQDTRSTTGTTALASNASASASAGTGAGASGGGESTGGSSTPSATTLRQHHHHHHHHSPFQSSRHSLPPLERDSLARSPSTLAGFGSTNDSAQPTAPSTSSSGAALRYLLSSQGFGQNSRRSRAAQRMLSNDLMAFQQGQPSLFSSLSALSSPVLGPDAMLASTGRGPSSTTTGTRRHTQDMDTSLLISSAPPMGSSSGAAGGASSSSASGSASATASSTSPRVRSPFEQMQDRQDRLRRYMPLREFSMELMPESFRNTDSNASGSSFLLSDDLEPTADPTVARASSSSQRRRVIVAENMRQAREQQIRQLYAQTLRARPPPVQPSSTQTSSSQAQPSSSQASTSLSSEPSNPFRQHYIQQLQEQRARRQYDQLRQLEQSQHAHQQALQALQGQRLVAPEDTQQLSSSSQQDQSQPSTQALAQRYVLQDNGLRLVQPYPGTPGTPIPLSSTASDSVATSGLTSQSTGSLPALTSQQVLDEAYQEFSSSTERGRAAMRNALAADLHIEEDHQVLLTGEVSRRRRRRVVGRFSNSMGSPDIGSDNSSAIISQQQQQQEQREQESLESAVAAAAPTDSVSPLPLTSSITVQQTQTAEQQQQGTGPVTDATLPTSSSIATPSATTTSSTTTAAPTVPEVSVEMVDSQTTRDDAEHHGSSDSSSGSRGSSSGHLGLGLTSTGSTSHGQSVPPTPPSPNPNRNPMPTFQDRRRSSINPADIETLVREMEANAQSAAALGIRTTGGSSRPTSNSSPRIRFPLQALSPIVEPGGSTPPVALVPPLGILTPTSSNSSLPEPTRSGSRATQQPVLLSPEPERGAEHTAGPRSPPLQ